MKIIITTLIALLTLQPLAASSQTSDPLVWRTFAERLDVGSRIKVRLDDGRRVSATFVQAAPEALVIQPRTRITVPVQRVPYDAIASIERETGSLGAGKAVAIGIGAGAATFAGIFLVILAAFAD